MTKNANKRGVLPGVMVLFLISCNTGKDDVRAVINAEKSVDHDITVAVIEAVRSAGVGKFAINLDSE